VQTIAVLAQKGGAGKTTLAVHLAVLAQQQGKRTLIIDIDQQRSAAEWWHARASETPELVETTERQLDDVIAAAADDGVDVAIIDTPPHAAHAAKAAAQVADLVLIPCRPGILDMRAIGATVDLVRGMQRRAVIVLNQCQPARGVGEAGIVREAREGLASYGMPVCPVAVTQRAALSYALIDGRAVTEFEASGKAAGEINKLWEWIEHGAREAERLQTGQGQQPGTGVRQER